MQDDDADFMLTKTLDKVNEKPTTGISYATETFGFSHLRQGESSIPLTQELCWQKYFWTHFQWNRTSWTGRDGSSLSLSLWELLCYFWGDSGLNISEISEHPTHTPIFPYKPAPPNTTCIGSACSITPMQHSAKQSTLLKGLWNKIKEWIPSFTKHNIILSKENSDTESHLNLWFSQWGFWKHRWVAGAAGDVVEDFQWLLVKQKLLRVNLNVSFLKLFVRMDTF